MIGNDVVDLELSRKQSDWRRKGFLEKIFTTAEIAFILRQEKPEVAVWAFWTAKESVYKIVNRETGERSFNPSQFACTFPADMSTRAQLSGSYVTYNDRRFFVQVNITSDFIYAEATSNGKFADYTSVFSLEKIAVRDLIKENDIPWIINKTGKFPVSITHHGRFHAVMSQL